MNYLPTCTSRLAVQHPCQVSFKFMQGCRRSWEDKLKCVKILSVKDHNSAKICRTWIISPHALLVLWCNIPAKFHSNPCKDVGGVEKTNFDGTEWRKDGMTEGRTKQTLNAPLPFYGGGIKSLWRRANSSEQCEISKLVQNSHWVKYMMFIYKITEAKFAMSLVNIKKWHLLQMTVLLIHHVHSPRESLFWQLF